MGINTKERCLRPPNGLEEKRCFLDRNTNLKCRNSCIASGLGTGRESVLQQHSGADEVPIRVGQQQKGSSWEMVAFLLQSAEEI